MIIIIISRNFNNGAINSLFINRNSNLRMDSRRALEVVFLGMETKMKKKHNQLRTAILHAVLVSMPAAAIAEQADKVEMDTVNVWGTSVESSSMYLNEGDINIKQADHLSDLLVDIPGVDVGGTHSINNRINIRGFQDEDLEMSIDGAKIQNANMFHHIGNLLINPDILKSADIQVGTNSVVNSSLGGAVAFETKDGKGLLRPGETMGARVSGNFNSNDEHGGSFAGYGKLTEKADFLAYYRQVEKNNWTDGDGTENFGVEGTIYNALLKFGVDLDENNRISLSYDSLHDEGDYSPRPDFGRAYNEARTGDYTFPTEYDRTTISLRHELDLGDKLFMTTTVYSNENELERFEKLDGTTPVRPMGGGPPPTWPTEGLLNGKVKTQGINLQAQSVVESGSTEHVFTYGALVDKQTSEVKWNGEKYGDNESAVTKAFYIEDEIALDSGLTVTPGIRYTDYDFDGAYGEIDDSEITYGLAGEYQVNQSLSVNASSTTLFKGVEMVDVLAANREYVPDNEDLKSETGVNNQIRLKYRGNQLLGADSLGVMVTYFETKINDYIVQEYDNMSNGGTLDVKGFEASVNYEVDKLNAVLSYSHSTSDFEETKEPLVKEPGDMLTLGLTYKINPEMSVHWDSIFVSKEDDRPDGAEYNVKEAYNVHDIAFNWEPKSVKGLKVTAGIDNIFDEAYVSHISENRSFTLSGSEASTADYEPGRNVKIMAAYQF